MQVFSVPSLNAIFQTFKKLTFFTQRRKNRDKNNTLLMNIHIYAYVFCPELRPELLNLKRDRKSEHFEPNFRPHEPNFRPHTAKTVH